MDYDVGSHQVNASGEFEYYFQYHFYCNGVTRLCPRVQGFKTRKDAEQAAREPVHVEAAEAYMERVLLTKDGHITPIWYTVHPKDNVNHKRYAGIMPDAGPQKSYTVVAFKNETVRRAAHVRATEEGFKFWDMQRKQISHNKADAAPMFDHSNEFRNYLRAQ